MVDIPATPIQAVEIDENGETVGLRYEMHSLAEQLVDQLVEQCKPYGAKLIWLIRLCNSGDFPASVSPPRYERPYMLCSPKVVIPPHTNLAVRVLAEFNYNIHMYTFTLEQEIDGPER